jgi:hypothetical protein
LKVTPNFNKYTKNSHICLFSIFQAEDIHTLRHYAIKREPLKMRHPQIKHESIIYDVLAGGRKYLLWRQLLHILTLYIAGIPQCHWHGQHEGFDCIVIDLLGPNINQLKEVTKTFSIDVVVEFGCQMVSIFFLHKFHSRTN